jgi:ABC-2 type transport system permease protein
VDFNYAQTALFNGTLTGEQWANLGVTSVIWLLVPLAVGVAMVLRSEVK